MRVRRAFVSASRLRPSSTTLSRSRTTSAGHHDRWPASILHPCLESPTMANPETNKPTGNGANPPLSIVKPADDFDLDRFRSTQPEAAVKALQTVLPHYKIAAAKDYVRLHPDKEIYWSHELCFVNVPVKGQ